MNREIKEGEIVGISLSLTWGCGWYAWPYYTNLRVWMICIHYCAMRIKKLFYIFSIWIFVCCYSSGHQSLSGIVKVSPHPQRHQGPCSSFNSSMENPCACCVQLLGRGRLVWVSLPGLQGEKRRGEHYFSWLLVSERGWLVEWGEPK